MDKGKRLPLALLALLLAATTLTLLWPLQPEQGKETRNLPPGGDFGLQSARGPVTLHDYRGKVVLLYFGYTSCPDICPTSLAMMKVALSQLEEAELAQVQGIFISVDPERDTPQQLAQYTAHFHPGIIGVTGSPVEIAAVARRYGAIFQRAEGETALGYTVDHSSVTYLIDRQGELRATLPHGATPAIILQEVRRLLAEPKD